MDSQGRRCICVSTQQERVSFGRCTGFAVNRSLRASTSSEVRRAFVSLDRGREQTVAQVSLAIGEPTWDRV